MNTLVLYFSATGKTERIAEVIHSVTAGDMIKLVPKGKKLQPVIIAGFQAMMKMAPDMEPLAIDPAEYDLIFVGGPVWAGHAAPMINSLGASYPMAGKKVAFFCTCADKPGRTLEQMKALFPSATVLDTISVKTPLKDETAIVEWVRGVVGKY